MRSQATDERRTTAVDRASPPPPPDEAGGSTRSGEDGGMEKSVGGNTGRDPSVGEKSEGARAGKGQQGTQSKSGTVGEMNPGYPKEAHFSEFLQPPGQHRLQHAG